MSTIRVDIPDDVARLLDDVDLPRERAALELIVLELFRRRTLSTGRAARSLGMERLDFLRLASGLGIPVIDMSGEEWDAEMERMRGL